MNKFRALLTAALVAFAGPAFAQSTLLQGGSWTSGHVPMYVGQTGGQTIVQDGGPASGGGPGIGVSEFNITSRGTGTAPYAGQGTGPNGETFCLFDAPSTNSTGYHSLCFSPNVSSGGLISYQANGAASAYPLNFSVNGVSYEFPFTTSGIVGPGTSVVNDAVCWNNTSGTLVKDCGAFVTVAGNNTWTGTNNFTSTFKIGGVTQTFPASGALVGTSDSQTLTNKSIVASQINSGTLSATVMPAYTGDVASSAGATVTAIQPGVVTNAMLATETQNTVKGAATSTAVANLAMPSCSAAGSALQWTTSTGFSCATLTNQSSGWGLTGSSTFSVSTTAPPFAFDLPINMAFTASVGASALTINVVAADTGTTPSATHPVLIPFRSTTLATGTVTWRAITGALTIVVPSAATLGTSNSVPFRIWIFAHDNAGTPELGVATCSVQSSTVTFYPCSTWEYARKTTIAIDGFSTSAGTLYATTAVSNDAVRLIGFAEYGSGLATAGAYASTPTTLQVLTPHIPRPGMIVQGPLTTTSTTASTTTSATFATLSTVVTQAITPSAASNPIRVKLYGTWQTSANSTAGLTLVNGSTAIGNPIILTTPGSGTATGTVLWWIDNPKSTSAQTYGVQGKNSSGTLSFPPASSGIEFEVEEIMGVAPGPANDNIHPGMFSATG